MTANDLAIWNRLMQLNSDGQDRELAVEFDALTRLEQDTFVRAAAEMWRQNPAAIRRHFLSLPR